MQTLLVLWSPNRSHKTIHRVLVFSCVSVCHRVLKGFLVCPSADNADVSRQMEEAETRAGQLSRSRALLQSQLEELKKHLDEEVKVSACVCVWVCVCV